MSRTPSLGSWRRTGSGSPSGLLGGAITNDGQASLPRAIRVDNGLGRAAAIDQAAEREMKIRIAGLLGKYDQVDLIRIKLERRVGPGDDFLAILLLHVLADRQDPDVGEDCLRRHDFDPAHLRGFLVAGKTDDVDLIVGENESAGRRIAAIVDLDRHGALSGRQDRRHEPAGPRLDKLIVPNRLAANE